MRKTSLFFFLLLALQACDKKKEIIHVTINLTNNPASQVVSVIGQEYDGSAIVLDTALMSGTTASANLQAGVNQKGIFSLKFEKEDRYILFTNDQPEITITADWDDFSTYSVNSPGSKALQNLLVVFNGHLKKIDEAQALMQQTTSDSLMLVYGQQELEATKLAKDYLLQFTDTVHNAAVALYALGLLQQKQPDQEAYFQLMQRLPKRFPDNEEIIAVYNDYNNYLNRQRGKPAVGKMAPLFSLPDTTGQLVSLNDFKGQYVLVDFWASWCGPCREENPNIVAAYNKYKDLNFTVLGVSLDKEKRPWLAAIEKDKLQWTQVSDLKEWKSPVAEAYFINAIPYNALLDPTGKIIGTNLIGTKLTNILEEVLTPVVAEDNATEEE